MAIFGKKALSLHRHIVCRLNGLIDAPYNMKQKTNKLLAFEYLVYRLIEWYKEATSSTEDMPSHFSRLSVLKLLFLTAAIKDNTVDDINKKDLLETFNNFCAMQYGPVEIDVYSAIVNDTLSVYRLSNKSTEVKCSDYKIFEDLSEIARKSIDNAINILKSKNANIIRYNATQLVNITHKWQSWQNAMWLANISGNRQSPMSIDSIRKDMQYYG